MSLPASTVVSSAGVLVLPVLEPVPVPVLELVPVLLPVPELPSEPVLLRGSEPVR